MKTRILIIVLFVTGFSAQSQINQGRVMVGGDFSYGSSSQQNSVLFSSSSGRFKLTEYGTRLRYGILITDHIMVGLSGGYNALKQVNINPGTSTNRPTHTHKQSGYGGGLFARYYQAFAGGKFAFFGQLSPTYNIHTREEKSEYANPNIVSDISTTKGNSFGVLINPGLTYFVNKTFALEASFGGINYNTVKSKNYRNGVYTGDMKSTSLGFTFLSAFSLGLNFYFGTVKTPAPEVTQ